MNPDEKIQETSCTWAEVPLYKFGKVVAYARVDKADLHLVTDFRWGLLVGKKTSYAYRQEHIKGTTSGNRVYYMHRVILGLPRGTGHAIEADHLDFNGLNNTRANLRVVTRSENNQNRRKFKNNKSGIVGVTFTKGRPGSDGSWLAGLYRDGAYIHRSTHKTKEAAGEAYAQALALYESKREQVSA
jgi:hypothetical protein